MISKRSLFSAKRFRKLSVSELAELINRPVSGSSGETISFSTWRELPGEYATGKAKLLYKRFHRSQSRPLNTKGVAKPAHNTASLKCPHCGKNVIVAVASGVA